MSFTFSQFAAFADNAPSLYSGFNDFDLSFTRRFSDFSSVNLSFGSSVTSLYSFDDTPYSYNDLDISSPVSTTITSGFADIQPVITIGEEFADLTFSPITSPVSVVHDGTVSVGYGAVDIVGSPVQVVTGGDVDFGSDATVVVASGVVDTSATLISGAVVSGDTQAAQDDGTFIIHTSAAYVEPSTLQPNLIIDAAGTSSHVASGDISFDGDNVDLVSDDLDFAIDDISFDIDPLQVAIDDFLDQGAVLVDGTLNFTQVVTGDSSSAQAFVDFSDVVSIDFDDTASVNIIFG